VQHVILIILINVLLAVIQNILILMIKEFAKVIALLMILIVVYVIQAIVLSVYNARIHTFLVQMETATNIATLMISTAKYAMLLIKANASNATVLQILKFKMEFVYSLHL